MINRKSLSLYILIWTTALSSILMTMQPRVKADDSKQIAKAVQETTVQINNSLSSNRSPGGSGVIIDKKNNVYTVLTANHVVCDGPPSQTIICRQDISYSVRTYDGQEYLLERIENIPKTQDDTDIALGFFQSERDYPVARIGDSDQAVIGSDIYVGGFPTTFEKIGKDRDFSLTIGAVVSRPNNITKGYNLVYDARTKVGMSGGPVFDVKKRLIGIHGRGDGKQLETGSETLVVKSGFNAAIPINAYKTNCQQISSCSDLEVDYGGTGENPTASLNNPETARDYYKKGLQSQSKNDFQGAIINYSKALVLSPDIETEFLIHFNTGYIYLLTQRWQDSINSYNRAIKLQPYDAKAHSERADARRGLEDFSGAISDYNRAIYLDPNFADAYNNRAFIYNRLGNYQEAKADLEKASQLYLTQGRVREYQIVNNNLIKVQRNQDLSSPNNPSPSLSPPVVNPSNSIPPPVVNPNQPSTPNSTGSGNGPI